MCHLLANTTIPKVSDVSSTSVEANGKMPKWLPRAIALFWLGFLATFLVRNTVQKLSSLALLLLVATFITLALEPAVNRLSARGMKRGSATGLMLVSLVVATLGFVAAMGTIVGQQVADLLANSERYVNDIVKIINDVGNTRIDPAEVNATISDPNGPVQKFILAQRDNAFKVSVQAVGALFQGFSVLLFAFYFIADGPRLRRVICSRLKPERQRAVLDAWELAITKTGGFLYSRALLAVLSAFFHWILFQSVGAPAPIAMALWVGLISQFIPVIGTYLAGVLPVLLTFIESPTKALIILGFIFFYQQLENYLFSPRITARTLELHPALAFGGALAGAAVLGPIGALLALPGVAMGQALISAWGVRHDVIDDPLTHVAPTKVREKKSKKSKSNQES
jgi:predicted PurR-regulated permease PerM